MYAPLLGLCLALMLPTGTQRGDRSMLLRASQNLLLTMGWSVGLELHGFRTLDLLELTLWSWPK